MHQNLNEEEIFNIKQAGFAEPHSISTIGWVLVGLGWVLVGVGVGFWLGLGLGWGKHLGPDKKVEY